jgi:outer membrane protein TolC
MRIFGGTLLWGGNKKLTGVFAILICSFAISREPVQDAFSQQQSQPAQPGQVAVIQMSPIELAEQNGTALHISLKELTKLALQSNLDIAISDTNEAMYQQKIVQNYGYYDPGITLGLGTGRNKSANTNITNQSATTFNQRDSANWNFAFNQYVPTGGGVTALFNSSRSDTNQTASLFTPQFTSLAEVQFTQPMMRNRHTDLTRSNIKLSNLDLKSSDSKFKQDVTNTISSVQNAYWDLVGAIRNYGILRQSVELAKVTVDQNTDKVAIGTLAAITVTEAQATQASRQIDLIKARQTIQSTENNLRSMISTDRNAEIWRQTIVPTDAPDFKAYPVDLGQAIETALKSRPELEQYNIQLQQNDITLQLQKDSRKWQFDFVGTLGSNGTAGPQSFSSTGAPKIPTQFVGGIPSSYRTIFTEGLYLWSVAFNVQIPLKSRTVDAEVAQTEIARRQLIMNRTKTEQNIIVQIRNAVDNLETCHQAVDAAKISRELAELELTAETERFNSGLSQNFLLLQRQTDLATAQGSELQALIDYKKAIISLQLNMYNLLELNDFEIAKGTGKTAPSFR